MHTSFARGSSQREVAASQQRNSLIFFTVRPMPLKCDRTTSTIDPAPRRRRIHFSRPTMQLDKTRITIRERSFLDILDLSLQVIREHAGHLALWLAVGILPFALFNAWLLDGLVESFLEMDVEYN